MILINLKKHFLFKLNLIIKCKVLSENKILVNYNFFFLLFIFYEKTL